MGAFLGSARLTITINFLLFVFTLQLTLLFFVFPLHLRSNVSVTYFRFFFRTARTVTPAPAPAPNAAPPLRSTGRSTCTRPYTYASYAARDGSGSANASGDSSAPGADASIDPSPSEGGCVRFAIGVRGGVRGGDDASTSSTRGGVCGAATATLPSS